jgi:hypothetical protein
MADRLDAILRADADTVQDLLDAGAQTIMADRSTPVHFQEHLDATMRDAVLRDDADTVRDLLDDGRADSATKGSMALVYAACCGCVNVVRALLDDGRADPVRDDSAALRCSRNAAAVRLLLDDGRADPAAEDSCVLRCAARFGFVRVVQLLLDDGRADPAAVVYADCASHVWPLVEVKFRWRRRRAWLFAVCDVRARAYNTIASSPRSKPL